VKVFTCECGHTKLEKIEKLPAQETGCSATVSGSLALLLLCSGAAVMAIRKKKD
jgi:hypothetical protein